MLWKHVPSQNNLSHFAVSKSPLRLNELKGLGPASLLSFPPKGHGMKTETSKLKLEDFLEKIRHARECQGILASLNHRDLKSTSLHAVHLVQSLYSEESSDQANINRITLNLESSAADLIALSHLLKELIHVSKERTQP